MIKLDTALCMFRQVLIFSGSTFNLGLRINSPDCRNSYDFDLDNSFELNFIVLCKFSETNIRHVIKVLEWIPVGRRKTGSQKNVDINVNPCHNGFREPKPNELVATM